MEILRKYGVQTDFYFPLVKVEAQDFALSSDYTYAAGDIKIIKDGGSPANPTNNPSAITSGNTAIWQLTLTATEMQAALIQITVSDSATKVIEDQAVLIATYGNASAQHAFDLDTAAATVPTASEIADAVLDEALTEPAGIFAWGSATLRTVVAWLGALSRNKMLQTATETTLRNDADDADIATSDIADDGTTFTRDEWS